MVDTETLLHALANNAQPKYVKNLSCDNRHLISNPDNIRKYIRYDSSRG